MFSRFLCNKCFWRDYSLALTHKGLSHFIRHWLGHKSPCPERHFVSSSPAQVQKKPPLKVVFNGALGEIRTHDPCLRRAILYPAELQVLNCCFLYVIFLKKATKFSFSIDSCFQRIHHLFLFVLIYPLRIPLNL